MSMTNDTKKFEEVTISSQPIFEGKIITVQVDQVRLPNGETAGREIVRHPGAVAVVAIVDNKLLVVEQYRKPMEQSMVEIPAGKLDPGEVPIEAAGRELAEETGYRAGKITPICSVYTSPGFSDELLHLYFASDLTKGEAHLDEDEFLECEAITLEQAEQYIAEGRIADAKTIMAVYVWKLYNQTGKF